jgi:hypothetical protein
MRLYQDQCHRQSFTIGRIQFSLSRQPQQYEWFQDLVLSSVKPSHQNSYLHLQADDVDLNEDDLQFKHKYSKHFFYDDGLSMPPVPVLINIHHKNAQIFFIHFLLLHGKYITKIDVLHHSLLREMLQSAQLIGRSTDDDSLHN